ncbi:MAG: alpha/beta hydrolase [Kiloniellales bacterium]|nr:alpha/beta hydrolase [Kiloniellales bacterium]MDJ0971664.1 alpha/beta hydrolase [Kiloniellales bacterium]
MTILGTAVIGYGALLAIMFLLQRSFLYFPSADVLPLADGMTQVETQTDDGLGLRHWYRPPREDGSPVLVVFHGNAGNLSHRVPKYIGLAGQGHGILFVGYRGYGGNPGKPSQDGLLADGRSALDWLAGQGIGPERVVLYGESLGSGVAVHLAAERPVAGVVLEAPYSSVAEVAQHHYWYLPAKWLILDKWDSVARVDELSVPLLVLHGERDRVIPPRFGKRLFAAAKQPKELLLHPEAGHNDLLAFPQVARRVEAFLGNLVSAGARLD